jgi:hypothetical protein
VITKTKVTNSSFSRANKPRIFGLNGELTETVHAWGEGYVAKNPGVQNCEDLFFFKLKISMTIIIFACFTQ